MTWALITGASSGIGRALALELAARGQPLVLVARREAELRALADGLTVPTRVVALDLAAPEATADLDRATADLDLSVVVLNAGFGTSGAFLDADPAVERELVQLNVAAVLDGCHAFAPRLARRGQGALVLLSSVLAFQGVPHATTYAASKAFVQSLAEGLRHELAGAGVDVLAVAPGPTRTGFAARAGMHLAQADGADRVAAAIARQLSGHGRRGTLFPGWLGALLRVGVLSLPRWARTLVFGRAMEGMAG